MVSDTKERILVKALEMFSEYGYNGTNLRDLARSLGLSKSALYRHYAGKEAIWDAVIEMMRQYYAEGFGSPEHLPPVPESREELLEMTWHMIRFTVHDEKVIRTRKLLLTEQFRDEKVRQLATYYFLYSTEEIFAGIFAAMMDKGRMRRDDPELLAFAYTAPITALIHLCDRQPEKEAEAMEKARRFLEHFAEEHLV